MNHPSGTLRWIQDTLKDNPPTIQGMKIVWKFEIAQQIREFDGFTEQLVHHYEIPLAQHDPKLKGEDSFEPLPIPKVLVALYTTRGGEPASQKDRLALTLTTHAHEHLAKRASQARNELETQVRTLHDTDEDELLDLPFAYHETEAQEGNPDQFIVWTTFHDEDTVDHVAIVEVPDDDPKHLHSEAIAQFVTKALNHYANTPEGRELWKKTHPHMSSQRQ